MSKRCLVFAFCVLLLFVISGCKKEEQEIIIINDTSDINLAIGEFDTLNPIETKSKDVQSIMNTVYEPLFSFDDRLHIVPVLASGYKMSDDGRQITIDLQDSVKWHNGTIFTAEDVVYTLSRIKSSKGLYADVFDRIDNFTQISKSQVVINLNKPYIDFAYFLTFPIISKDTEYLKDDGFVPMGTGAYKFSEKSGNKITLDINSAWHGENIPKKKILVKVLNGDVSVRQAFNSNETDAIYLEGFSSEDIAPKGSAVSKKIVLPNVVFLGFNAGDERLTPRVREAVSILVEKDAIVEKCAYGNGKICNYSINPDSWAYKITEEDKKSKNYVTGLIKKDGLVLNDGTYERNGEKQFFKLLVNSENPEKLSVANAVCENLKAVGFETTVEALPYESYIDKIRNDDFDMFIGEVQTNEFINPCEMLLGEENYFNYDNTELLEKMKLLYGGKNYKRNISKVLEVLKENPAYVPLYYKTSSMYYGQYVSGITTPNYFNRYKNIEKWYFYNKGAKEEKEND